MIGNGKACVGSYPSVDIQIFFKKYEVSDIQNYKNQTILKAVNTWKNEICIMVYIEGYYYQYVL